MSSVVDLPVGAYSKEMMSLNHAVPSPKCAAKANHPAPGGFTLQCAKQLLQCKDCSNPVKNILPQDLANRLSFSKSRILLLDCRPFIAYNLNHISGALNISCGDRFTKRKLERGKASVGDLVSGHQDAKNIFKEYLKGSDIILYDESTTDFQDLATSNPLHLVLSNLLKDGHEAFLLKGGLKEFHHHYSELCAKNATDDTGPLFSPTTPLICSDIATATASKILPYLYLGNERDAHSLEKLKELGITHVLNVTSHIPFHFVDQGIEYKRLPASDSCHQKLSEFFNVAFDLIDGVRKRGGRVLVHCQAGVSRSATITIAYIMKHSMLSMLDAYKYVKSKRSIIAPNFNFMGQLMEFEKQINEGSIARCLENQLVLDTNA